MKKLKSVIELFEEQVLHNPKQIAIVYQDHRYTYDELNKRANSIADYLLALGTKKNSVIGIAVERSFDLIASVIGILKAGATCFPLDINYPSDRIKFMIEDTEPFLILTSEVISKRLPPVNTKQIFVHSISHNKNSISKFSYPSPEDLIYIIYTSGSTGKPKGIKMPHRVISNLIDWQNHSSTPGHYKTLQFAPISFDVSFQEIFSTLTNGDTLYLIEDDLRKDPLRLVGFLSENKIERIFLPYIALQILAEASESNEYNFSLKHVITAGEQLKITPQIIQFFKRNPQTILHNQYGPSETHVCTSFILSGNPEDWPKLPPIGNAIQNSEVILLDGELKKVPKNSEGEIFIGGECVANGYWNREELTHSRFVKLILNQKEKIFYKTGDLGKVNENNDIEFLGRADDQIKLHGYRIEPGEIENLILSFPKVKSVAVVLRETKNRQKELAAYFSADNVKIDANALSVFLSEKLPTYMIPKFFIQKEKLPLTPSGKVDKRALLNEESESVNLTQSESNQIIIDSLEKEIIEIWKEVLGIQEFSIEDNFFDLGGNSISIGKLQIKLKEKLNEEISIVDLYNYPSVYLLRKYVSEKRNLLLIKNPQPNQKLIKPQSTDIAIIGIAGRYPKAKNI
ncbi:non-ribosomal peptide synthetase, partial [Ignavibacterium sp.]|uniref:non-ribosomal peptide synthetase n=1 Tax=Ignavibacterium sp. TaxID=2651167 RepID=UPI00307E2FB2